MAMTKPIPKALRDEMEADPFYRQCCLTGIRKDSSWERIEWHHNFESYLNGNKGRVNEKWCILPVAKTMHDRAKEPWIKRQLDRIMLNRADDATLRKWSKVVDLIKYRDQLNKEYENQEN